MMGFKSRCCLALALGLAAVLATTGRADESLFQEADLMPFPETIHQQRALLATTGTAGYYSPAYSPKPSPAYSPAYSPKPSPTPSPTTPLKPSASPKPCKFAATTNSNTYTLSVYTTRPWGVGRNAILRATAAVYKRYSQRLRVKVTGPAGQFRNKRGRTMVYTVVVPVTPCVGFKQGMRASLRKALKGLKFGSGRVTSIKVVA